uniref:Uncharacterized protein n=1 Tax=Setaria digitata TaxID=48799 RepID=A0A915PVI2_9BILA
MAEIGCTVNHMAYFPLALVFLFVQLMKLVKRSGTDRHVQTIHTHTSNESLQSPLPVSADCEDVGDSGDNDDCHDD